MAARKKISYASNYSDNSEKENIKPVANKSLRYDFTHNKNGTMSKSIDAGKCKLMRQAAVFNELPISSNQAFTPERQKLTAFTQKVEKPKKIKQIERTRLSQM
jgi:hypothetical protein